jgi:hypothetical protein
VHLTQLYELADVGGWLGMLRLGAQVLFPETEYTFIYPPWPYYDGYRFYFEVEFINSGYTQSDVTSKLEGAKNIRLISDSYPLNCTVPEMLRDLYGFPVTGHIEAVAFDPEEVGRRRYNVAQAALRRACSRLQNRELIAIRGGQQVSLFSTVYQRSWHWLDALRCRPG